MSAFSAGETQLLGKARHQAEFLRARSAEPSIGLLDSWLTDSVEWAAARAGAEWPRAFAGSSIQAFLFQPRELGPEHAACGVFGPSADSAGRQFPLVIAAPIRASATVLPAGHFMPFFLEGFWAAASEVLSGLLATHPPEPQSTLSGLHCEPALDEREAQELYGTWTADLRLGELWALLDAPLGPNGTPDLALRWLLATLEPFRGHERPKTPLSLRVPLGQAAGLALCFWLDVVQRALGWHATLPSFFWSHDGERGSALLHVGVPPRCTLAELFLPSEQRDEIVDLARPPAAEAFEGLPPLPVALAEVVAQPDLAPKLLLEVLSAGAA